jgi:UDP-2,3-diacylglucosamine hydrolase
VADDSKLIGLIAGNGRLPHLFAEAARQQGLEVVAVGHRGETDPQLELKVRSLSWVRLAQIDRIVRILREAGVTRAVMAGGISRIRAFTEARPDSGALHIALRLRSFRDDGLLRAVADYFQRAGVQIVSPTDFLTNLLVPPGHLAGPGLEAGQRKDIALGIEVAQLLGRADVGQTVVVKNGHVLAMEAIEGTNETIRRAGKLGGPGAVVVKFSKPQQDPRFDLPTVGPGTLEAMEESGAKVLAVEAGRTLILEGEQVYARAQRQGVTLVGVVNSKREGVSAAEEDPACPRP